MLKFFGVLLFVTITFVCTENFQVNRTAELIPTYAKVARWGASNNANEGRSNGQTLWAHRSDVNLRRGQNLKKKQPVTYYYSMRAPTSKLDNGKIEPMPYKGEVQERFNPRPYFDFTFDNPPRQTRRPNGSKSNVKQTDDSSTNPKPPAIVYGAPPDSFQNLDTLQKPPTDAYSSPFNSYNPPKIKPDDSKDNTAGLFNFPPNNSPQPSPPVASYAAPNDDKKQPPPPSVSYGTPDGPSGPSVDSPPSYVPDFYGPPADTYGPPDTKLKPPKNTDKPSVDKKPSMNNKYPGGYDFHPPLAQPPPSDDLMPKKPDTSYFIPPPPPPADSPAGPYYLPPVNENGNENKENNKGNDDHPSPPSNGEGMENDDDKQPSSQPDEDYGPPISQTVEPPGPAQPPYLEHPPTNQDYHHHPPADHSMAEGDLSPPPAGVPYGKIPQYLDHEPNDHDFYHFGHHDIYHEVHTTAAPTTTEAPRAGHYSYYYLGRKLWYIPLYFSVYFIVYVTVLILKSIARHKIQFTHHFDKSRASRQLELDNVNKTVITAIEKTKQMYM